MSGGQIGFGGSGGSDANTQRTVNDDTQIIYIPLDDLDKAMREEKKTPAMTIVPLRLVVIHASFPLALQREEIRRALRLVDVAQVTASGQPEFAGFKVRRRIIDTDGTVLGTNPPKKITELKPEDSIVKDGRTNDGWAEYDYKDKYIELIHARKMSDHFDAIPERPETGYLPSFLRYEEGMAMPLPDMVGDMSIYPSLKLKQINAQIQKWEAMRRPKQDASDMVNRLRGKNKGDGNPFIPQTAQDSAASTFFGDQKFRGPQGMTSGAPPGLVPGAPPPPGIGPKIGGPPPGMGIPGMPPPGTPGVPGLPGTEAGGVIDPEHLLLRFLDCDVQPGLTYQYQIQVVMKNPNYRAKTDPEYKTQAAMMAKPDMVDQQFILGAWTQIGEAITIPSEAFLYAIDRDDYHKKLVDEFSPKSTGSDQPGQPSTTAKERRDYKDIMRRLDVKDDQVVIEVQQWREEVRTESGGAREPVGKWVVANMPVGRGEFIGKKTFVKLPLWSSKDTAYTFREMPAKVFKGDKQPEGWLVDFSSRWLLVDFEGGKSRTRLLNGRTIDEDAAADLLVVRPDGSLVVLNSAQGTDDPGRQERLKKWDDWLKETKKPGEAKKDDFARPPGMN